MPAKVEGRRGQPRVSNGDYRTTLEEDGKRVRIYGETKNAREAAKLAGTSSAGWAKWCIRRGLPPRNLDLAKDGLWLQAWRKANNTAEAARMVGATYAQFHSWQTKMGLPSKGPWHLVRPATEVVHQSGTGETTA